MTFVLFSVSERVGLGLLVVLGTFVGPPAFVLIGSFRTTIAAPVRVVSPLARVLLTSGNASAPSSSRGCQAATERSRYVQRPQRLAVERRRGTPTGAFRGDRQRNAVCRSNVVIG